MNEHARFSGLSLLVAGLVGGLSTYCLNSVIHSASNSEINSAIQPSVMQSSVWQNGENQQVIQVKLVEPENLEVGLQMNLKMNSDVKVKVNSEVNQQNSSKPSQLSLFTWPIRATFPQYRPAISR